MKFKIYIYKSAEKDLKDFPAQQQVQILKEINSILSENPFPNPPVVKKFKGIKLPLYRLRIRNLRVIYRIARDEVVVLKIIDRKELDKVLKHFH